MRQTVFARSDTVQDVLSHLRKDIILYHFKDNQPVREQELADRYLCSRGAVRNALVMLEKEGLIVSHINGTKTVSCLSLQDIHNIYDLREFIELTSIRQFFDQRRTDMAEIFEIANQLRTIVPSEDNIDTILELDTRFHGCVVALSKNKALIQTWNNISNVICVIFSLNMKRSKEYQHDFINTFHDSHTELVSYLLSDKTNCLELFQSHIENARHISVGVVKKMLEEKV